MTITRQIIIVFILSLALLFMGTFLTTMLHIKAYYEDQLNMNAQDTATALGLTLSESSLDKNATNLSQVKAVFDQGYFSSIKINDINNNLIVQRHILKQDKVAPDWFKFLISIENEEKKALIMKGWRQVGTVYVKSNSALAYKALWQTLVYLFLLYSLLTIILSILGTLLINHLLKPLKLIIRQAEDIGEQKLYLLAEKPSTRELRKLSDTMNAMVTKLQKIFAEQLVDAEALRSKIYVDSLTQLGNRRYFFHHFDDFLNNDEKFATGYLVLIEASGLLEFNKKNGYAAGDRALRLLAETLQEASEKHSFLLLSRLDGPHFAFVLSIESYSECEEILHPLYHKLNTSLQSISNKLSLALAACQYQFHGAPSKILEMADKQLSIAREKKTEKIEIQASDLSRKKLNFMQSEDKFKAAMKKNQFCFYTQSVRSDSSDFHKEVYVKLLSPEGIIAAACFLPLAKKIGLDYKIDEYLLEQLAIHSLTTEVFAVNLSYTVIYDSEHQKALINLLEKSSLPSKNIHFEVNENILARDLEKSTKLLHRLQDMGYKTGIDQAGATLLSFSHFSNYNIQYLKLDPAITKKLDGDDYKRKIIQNFVNICENMDITLIATQIETHHQYQVLKDLNIKWFQGNYIEKPILFSSPDI